MSLSDTEGLPTSAITRVEYSDLSPKAKSEQTLRIADNFLTSVEGRIAKTGVGSMAANVARYEAVSAVENMLTLVYFDLISSIESAVGPLDLSDIQNSNEADLLKRLKDKIGAMQFSANFTPYAQPAETIYTILT